MIYIIYNLIITININPSYWSSQLTNLANSHLQIAHFPPRDSTTEATPSSRTWSWWEHGDFTNKHIYGDQKKDLGDLYICDLSIVLYGYYILWWYSRGLLRYH